MKATDIHHYLHESKTVRGVDPGGHRIIKKKIIVVQKQGFISTHNQNRLQILFIVFIASNRIINP